MATAAHTFTEPRNWQDRIAIAKVDATRAPAMLLGIIAEAEAAPLGSCNRPELLDWANAAQYALDSGDFDDLDYLIALEEAPYPRDEPYYSHRSDERPCAAVFGGW